MKLSKPVTERFTSSYTRTGRKRGYKVEIIFNSLYDHFYFMLHKDEYVFNSLWKNSCFETEEECAKGAEKFVDELAKMGGK